MQFGFVQPIFFWGLAGLAIPIAAHLVFKRRSRRVNLGTLRFLKIVVQQNAHWRSLKRWLLLALRLTCIALLVGLFARPHLRGRETEASRQCVTVLVDQSASMERNGDSGRLIDQAVAQARRILERFPDDTELKVAFFDHGVHALDAEDPKNSTGKAKSSLLKRFAAPSTLIGSTNYSAAMAWARDVSVSSKQQQQRVVILTDLQRSGLAWAETAPLPPGVDVELIDLGQQQTSNAAVSAVETPTQVVRPGKSTTISVTIYNAGPFSLEKVDVALHLSCRDQQINLKQQISLASGSTGSLSFATPEMDEGLWRGFAELRHEDDLKFDNKRSFAVLVAKPLATLIVDGQPNELPQRTASYFLNASLRLAPPGEIAAERLFDPTVLPLETDTTLPDLHRQSLVILANVPMITQSEAARLANWVRAGGGLLVFAGEPTTAEGMKFLSDAGLGVGAIQGFATSSEAPWRLEKWNSVHPIFEPFGDVLRGDLSRRSFQGITRIEPAGDSEVLAHFTGGPPAVITRSLEKGRVIWFAAGCDGIWSDWPRSRLYLPLNYQLLSYLGGLAEGGPVRNITTDSQSQQGVSPGVYEEGNHWNVINVSPRESETDRCTIEEFSKRFGFSLDDGNSADATAAPVVTAGLDVRDDEFWHLVLFGLLALILIEGFLANRTVS